eukprot:gene7139-biopygen16953
MGPKRGTSVYRGVAWDKACGRWRVQIRRLNEQTQTYVGLYNDKVEAALAYDAAAIALGKTDGLNFPEQMSEAKITDALLFKLFKTTDRKKVEEIVEQHHKENGNALSKEWKALLQRNLNIMPEGLDLPGRGTIVDAQNHGYKCLQYDSGRNGTKPIRPFRGCVHLNAKEQAGLPESLWAGASKEKIKDPAFTGGEVGRKRKKPMPRGSKKANMSESSEDDTEEEAEEEELPMHDDDNADNVHIGINDDNEEAIQEDKGTDDVQGQGPAAASSDQDGPAPRKRRRRERRGEGMSGEEDAEPPQEIHAGGRGPGGVGNPLVIGDQPQQILYTGGRLAPADLPSAVVVKQEPDCLEQAGGALLGLVFSSQASMIPAQAPALSSEELAVVLPGRMSTQLGPRIRILSSRTLSYPSYFLAYNLNQMRILAPQHPSVDEHKDKAHARGSCEANAGRPIRDDATSGTRAARRWKTLREAARQPARAMNDAHWTQRHRYTALASPMRLEAGPTRRAWAA